MKQINIDLNKSEQQHDHKRSKEEWAKETKITASFNGPKCVEGQATNHRTR